MPKPLPPNPVEREDEPLPHLRAWRRHLAFSRNEVADRAGLDAATVQRVEQAARARPRAVRVLAEALGLSPSPLRRSPPSEG
jgi:hypothetical protein